MTSCAAAAILTDTRSATQELLTCARLASSQGDPAAVPGPDLEQAVPGRAAVDAQGVGERVMTLT